MSVRIASIDLDGVQAIVTDEGRRWVEQHIPGRAGSVFQELGRSSVCLQLEGMLWREDALDALESLRAAQATAQPVPFSADITAGMAFTDVLIDTLHVRQVAGYRDRYWYRLRVREHVEEPPAPEAAQAAVDASVEADAASFAEGAVDAASGIQDATALPDLVAANPGLLDHLSTGDLAGSLKNVAGGLTGGGLGGILSSVGLDASALEAMKDTLKGVQMEDVIAVYKALQNPSSIPQLLKRPELLARFGANDLGQALIEKAEALTGGELGGELGGEFIDILKGLKEVDLQKAVALVNDLRRADSLGDFVESLASGGVEMLDQLTGLELGDATALILGVRDSADFLMKLKEVADKGGKLVSTLRGFDPLSPVRVLSGQAPGDVGQLSDIVGATGELISKLVKLLGTGPDETEEIMKAVKALVRQVGAEAELDSAVDLLAGVLDEVDRMLAGAREPLLQLGALQGLLTLTGSLVSGLTKLTKAGGEELGALGLGSATEAMGAITQALGMGQGVIDGATKVLDPNTVPTAATVDSLRSSVVELRTKLLGFRSSPPGGTR